MLQSLLNPNPQTKPLVNSLLNPPKWCSHDSCWRFWCSVDFKIHNTSYYIPISGRIHAVSDVEHKDQWCVLEHSTTIQQHAPSNCNARYIALWYPRAQCDNAGQKACFVTFSQPLYIKAPSIMRSIPDSSSVVACLDVHPAGWTWARMNSILTQRKASLPTEVVTGSEVVSVLAIEQVLACQKRFLVGSNEGVELQATLWLSWRVPYQFVYHQVLSWV